MTKPTGNPKYDNPERVERICANRQCRAVFHPRKVDVKRGWGRFCSKSCKAAVQTRRTGYAGPERDASHDHARFISTTTHGQDGTE
jgi:hypothetical protein